MRFDYLVLSETNQWLATGKNATELDLNEDLKEIQERHPDEELLVFRAQKMESSTLWYKFRKL